MKIIHTLVKKKRGNKKRKEIERQGGGVREKRERERERARNKEGTKNVKLDRKKKIFRKIKENKYSHISLKKQMQK